MEENKVLPPEAMDLTKVPEHVDLAAKHFQVGLPLFKKNIQYLSKKSLSRVLGALVEYPLQDDTKELLVTHDEMLAFQQAMELMDHKMQMITYVHETEIKKQETEVKKENEDAAK